MAAGRIKGITIEIGGDTTKLVKALSSVDNAISKTQKNLQDINKALKLDPANTQLLKDKQVELSKAIEDTKKKIETEKEAYAQLSKADQTPENIEKMRQLKVQIDLDTAALKDLENQAKQSASVLGTQMQVAGEKMKALGDDIKGIGDKLSGIGQSLTTKVTAPIVAGFTAAVKTTADFDAEMSKVQAISGATASEFSELRDKAREMGRDTKFSAEESAEAFEYMAMAGWKTDDMLEGITGILNLAAASGEELGTTSDIVTDALTAFGMEANEAGRFADILASAATNANTNVSMMGESFKYVAPVAGALGYSAEDVAVALGLMANSGIKADMAGTSLRNMFQRMAKPTKESEMAMERLGLSLQNDEGEMYSFREIMDQLRSSFKNINISAEEYEKELAFLDQAHEEGRLTDSKYESQLEELNKQLLGAEGAEKARAAAMLGGTRAMSGLLAIANATEEDYNQLINAIDGSSDAFAKLADGSIVPLNEAMQSGQEIMETYTGQAEAMAAQMQDNLSGQLVELKSKLSDLAISIGDMLMPTLREIVDKVAGVVTWLSSLDESEKKQILTIAAIVAAIGPVLLILGGVITAIGTIISAIGAVISVIGGLITGIAAVANPVTIVIALIAGLVAAFIAFYNSNEEFRAKVEEIWVGIQTVFQTSVEFIKGCIDALIQWLQPIIEAVRNVVSAVTEMVTTFLQAIWTYIQNIVTSIGDYIKSKLEEHKTAINAVLLTIKMIFQNVFTLITGVVRTAFNAIKTVISTVLNTIAEIVRAFTSVLKGDWQAALDHVKNAVSTAWDGIKALFNTWKDGLGDIFNGLKENMKNWAKDMIDNFINGLKEKLSAVKDTMANIADIIKSYIHFTQPDVGPLSDFDTYAPDMMKLFAQGIIDNASLITDAVSKSFDLKPVIMGGNRSQMLTNTNSIAQSQPTSVNITLEGDAGRLFRVVSIEADRNRQITGKSFAF